MFCFKTELHFLLRKRGTCFRKKAFILEKKAFLGRNSIFLGIKSTYDENELDTRDGIKINKNNSIEGFGKLFKN